MIEESLDLQTLLHDAFVNNSYDYKAMHETLDESLKSSFSYLYYLQKAKVEYEELFKYSGDKYVRGEDGEVDYKHIGKLYLDEEGWACFDIDYELIKTTSREKYRQSEFYNRYISFEEFVGNPGIFMKLPVIIIDDKTIWDYQIKISKDNFTVKLPYKWELVYEKYRNPENEMLLVYIEHKIQTLIIENCFYKRLGTGRYSNEVYTDKIFANSIHRNLSNTITIPKEWLYSVSYYELYTLNGERTNSRMSVEKFLNEYSSTATTATVQRAYPLEGEVYMKGYVIQTTETESLFAYPVYLPEKEHGKMMLTIHFPTISDVTYLSPKESIFDKYVSTLNHPIFEPITVDQIKEDIMWVEYEWKTITNVPKAHELGTILIPLDDDGDVFTAKITDDLNNKLFNYKGQLFLSFIFFEGLLEHTFHTGSVITHADKWTDSEDPETLGCDIAVIEAPRKRVDDISYMKLGTVMYCQKKGTTDTFTGELKMDTRGLEYILDENGMRHEISDLILYMNRIMPYDMPIPVENMMLFKDPIDSDRGYELLKNTDNISMHYPNIYRITDADMQPGDMYRLFYFYYDTDNFKYNPLNAFYFRFMQDKFPEYGTERIINGIYYNNLPWEEWTALQRNELKNTLQEIFDYEWEVYQYGEGDFLDRYLQTAVEDYDTLEDGELVRFKLADPPKTKNIYKVNSTVLNDDDIIEFSVKDVTFDSKQDGTVIINPDGTISIEGQSETYSLDDVYVFKNTSELTAGEEVQFSIKDKLYTFVYMGKFHRDQFGQPLIDDLEGEFIPFEGVNVYRDDDYVLTMTADELYEGQDVMYSIKNAGSTVLYTGKIVIDEDGTLHVVADDGIEYNYEDLFIYKDERELGDGEEITFITKYVVVDPIYDGVVNIDDEGNITVTGNEKTYSYTDVVIFKNKTAIQYKDETLKKWVKYDPEILRNYVLKQKKLGSSVHLFTNQIDLNTRIRYNADLECGTRTKWYVTMAANKIYATITMYERRSAGGPSTYYDYLGNAYSYDEETKFYTKTGYVGEVGLKNLRKRFPNEFTTSYANLGTHPYYVRCSAGATGAKLVVLDDVSDFNPDSMIKITDARKDIPNISDGETVVLTELDRMITPDHGISYIDSVTRLNYRWDSYKFVIHTETLAFKEDVYFTVEDDTFYRITTDGVVHYTAKDEIIDEEKIYLDDFHDMIDRGEVVKGFLNQARYVFSLNNESREFPDMLDLRVYVDGIKVIDLYHRRHLYMDYIYIPASMVTADSYIEVEIFPQYSFTENIQFNTMDDYELITLAAPEEEIFPTLSDVYLEDVNYDPIRRVSKDFFNWTYITDGKEYAYYETIHEEIPDRRITEQEINHRVIIGTLTKYDIEVGEEAGEKIYKTIYHDIQNIIYKYVTTEDNVRYFGAFEEKTYYYVLRFHKWVKYNLSGEIVEMDIPEDAIDKSKMKKGHAKLYLDAEDMHQPESLDPYPVKHVRFKIMKITPKDETWLGKPLKLRINKRSQGIGVLVDKVGYQNLVIPDKNFNFSDKYLRVFVNGRLLPRCKWDFFWTFYCPRLAIYEWLYPGDLVYMDVTPYKYTEVFYKTEIEEGENVIDLSEGLNKPFDIRYYDVYLNGRKLSVNNVFNVGPYSITLANINSPYHLTIYERERDWEWYGLDYTNRIYYFGIDDLFKKSYVTDEDKSKILKDLIDIQKDYRLNIHPNEFDEEMMIYGDRTGDNSDFFVFYYYELIPKQFYMGDVRQQSLEVLSENYPDIYRHYRVTNYEQAINSEVAERVQGYTSCVLLDPDKIVEGRIREAYFDADLNYYKYDETYKCYRFFARDGFVRGKEKKSEEFIREGLTNGTLRKGVVSVAFMVGHSHDLLTDEMLADKIVIPDEENIT